MGFFSISRNGTDDSDIWKHFSEKRGKERKISARGISRWFLGMECEPPGGSITLRSIDWILRKFNSDSRIQEFKIDLANSNFQIYFRNF